MFGNIDVSGFDAGDGKLTAGAAVGALLLIFIGLQNRSSGQLLGGAIVAGIGLAVAGYDLVSVSDQVSNFDSEFARASTGYGLYVCAGGFVLCGVGAMLARSQR